ncbi:MAG TPA: retroviral-like aspartic protease family protein [Chthoniobacter sp.]
MNCCIDILSFPAPNPFVQTKWLSLLVVPLAIAVPQFAHAERHIMPSAANYLRGTIYNNVANAIQRGATEHRPIWITAWDRVFFNSPEGQKSNKADYAMHYFFQKPETGDLLNKNFLQVFTTLDNPAIAQWLDPNDHTHEPTYIVLDATGTFVARDHLYANPEVAWKDVQKVAAKLGIAPGGGNPPAVPSTPFPLLTGNATPGQGPFSRPAATPPNSTSMRVAINSTPARLPAMPLLPQPSSPQNTSGRNVPLANAIIPPGAPSRISIPEVSAKTNRAAKHLTVAESKNTRSEQDTRWMSVEVNATFFQRPEVEYQVQCFFIAKNEASPFQTVYDAGVKISREANFRDEFVSQPLVGSTRTFTSVNLSSADGSVSGTANATTTITREKVVGWIVRVVAEGRVLSVQSNQPELAELASTHKDNFDTVASEVLATANYATTSNTGSGETTTAYMVVDNGILHVSALLNGVTTAKFVVDSGCSDVALSREVYQSLVQAGTIQKGDALPPSTRRIANGSTENVECFLLHSLRIGNTTVTNVAASVGSSKAPLLLGQTFLQRFREWKIDNTISALILRN